MPMDPTLNLLDNLRDYVRPVAMGDHGHPEDCGTCRAAIVLREVELTLGYLLYCGQCDGKGYVSGQSPDLHAVCDGCHGQGCTINVELEE